MQKNRYKNQLKIKKIEITNDKITGRGGLAFFLRYIEQIGFYNLIEKILGHIDKSREGLSLYQFTKQILSYFIDGTYMSIESFNEKKKDIGYTAALENQAEEMSSSHQIKRFFRKLMDNKIGNNIYREIIHRLFIWRLRIDKPEIIILGVDTMVMDNNDAKRRQGVEPTYKKKRGYQPLHISWGSYLVDILFRGGSSHSNHGTDFIDSVRDITELIRKKYNSEVPITVVCDSGFLDEKAFRYFEEELEIGYVITGKMYEDIKNYLEKIPTEAYKTYKDSGIWNYVEFGNKLKSWNKYRRAIFTRLESDEDGQMLLEFSRPDTILYTNIGQDVKFKEKLKKAGKEDLETADSIIRPLHTSGAKMN